MRRIPVMVLAVLAPGVGFLYAWSRFGEEQGPSSVVSVIIEGPEKHLVTREMAEASRGMCGRKAPEFARDASDGKMYALEELTRRGPVILTFIKDGCPCSEAAQPFFNEVRTAYPGATILGVVDVGPGEARRWAARFRVSYPLLLDPGLDLVWAYGVENSAYVILVDPTGRIAGHWPGYSASMLQELGAMLARLSASEEKPLDLSDAPDELYTGCPYDL